MDNICRSSCRCQSVQQSTNVCVRLRTIPTSYSSQLTLTVVRWGIRDFEECKKHKSLEHVSNFFNASASFFVATETDFVLMTNFAAAAAADMSFGRNQQSCGPYSSRLTRSYDGRSGMRDSRNSKITKIAGKVSRIVDCRIRLGRTPADSSPLWSLSNEGFEEFENINRLNSFRDSRFEKTHTMPLCIDQRLFGGPRGPSLSMKQRIGRSRKIAQPKHG